MRLPKKPRPNTRIDACYVQAELKPLTHQYANSDDFQKHRFQYYAPTHSIAVAIGSTFQSASTNGKSHVLDASTIIYTTGVHGQRTGVLMALADGCGKVDSDEQNLSTGLVAKSACDYSVDEAKRNDNSDTLINKALIAG